MSSTIRIIRMGMLVLIGGGFVGQPSLHAQPAGSKDESEEEIEAYWNMPLDNQETFVEMIGQEASSVADSLERICAHESRRHPISPEQRKRLDAAAAELGRQDVQTLAPENLLFGAESKGVGFGDKPSPARVKYISTLRARASEKYDLRGLHPMWARWKEIATPEQWEDTREWRESLEGRQMERVREQVEEDRRLARGEFTEADIKEHNIDMSGPTDIRDLPPPDFQLQDYNWHYRVAAFVHRYRLTPAQQTAAKTILEDSRKLAREATQREKEKLGRLWKQMVTAYMFPQESKVSLKEAMRQYQEASQTMVRPIYEAMQKRLEGLLTTEQRTAVGPPPPKPAWMELMAVALEEDAERAPTTASASQPARPTTKPATAK